MKRGNIKTRPQKTDPLATGSTMALTIEGLDNDGIGWSRQSGCTISVPGAYPGEVIDARIIHRGRHRVSAAISSIITPSPARLAAANCHVAARCGGCPLINLSAEAQAAWKFDRVRHAIHAYKGLQGVTVTPLETPCPPLGYRNSCKLAIGGTHTKPVVGIYRRGSHDIVPIVDCPLHHPLVNRIVRATAAGIRKLKVPVFHPHTGNGILRYLSVRIAEASSEALVVLVTGQRSYNEVHHLTAFLQREVPEITVVAQNVNTSTGNVIFGPNDHFQTKRHQIIESIGHIRLQLSPRSFFQVNGAGAACLYQHVAEWLSLTGRERVLDVYCGVGGIGLYLARHAAAVTGLEEIEPAVADAERNARLNGLGNCRFMAGDASDLINDLIDDGEGFDRVVVNPPRSGCSTDVLDGIVRLSPPRLAYVSCNPDTLARDLLHLVQRGFRVAAVQPVDLFPQTPHVECVAMLEQA